MNRKVGPSDRQAPLSNERGVGLSRITVHVGTGNKNMRKNITGRGAKKKERTITV